MATSKASFEKVKRYTDNKITRLEKMNIKVQQLNDLSQKSKSKLQDPGAADLSIVCKMTGDPREKVYQKKERQRNKSRSDAERATRHYNLNQDLKKVKMQTG